MSSLALQNIRDHLEGLRHTTDGIVLYNLIVRGLKKYGGNRGKIERSFITFLHALLGRYAKDPRSDPATRIKARLIQQRLAPHLPESPPKQTRKAVAEQSEDISRWTRIDSLTSNSAAPAKRTVRATPDIRKPVSPGVYEGPEQPVKNEARGNLSLQEGHRKKIEEPRENLVYEVTSDVISDQETELEETSASAIADLDGKIDDINDLKKLLVKGLDKLIQERQALRRKLDSAGEYLKAVESDRRRLRKELTKARKHSLADELTGLPKREIFVRQLEAEIGRVRRYGFALALALIDLDDLSDINEQYGREAGDSVLRCYASEVLSKFRTYDLVARYGGDEFAVLFPNTQKEGAIKALEKARKNVEDTHLSHDGKTIPLPSFSSVLTLYSPGEQPMTLLKRADEALDYAKQRGRDRIVVALPAG